MIYGTQRYTIIRISETGKSNTKRHFSLRLRYAQAAREQKRSKKIKIEPEAARSNQSIAPKKATSTKHKKVPVKLEEQEVF